MNDPIVFKPSLERLLFKRTVAFALAFSLAMGIYAISSGLFQLENWLILSLAGPVFYFFGMYYWYSFRFDSNPNLYTLEITDQQIVGPMFWGPRAVPVKEVDVAKSRRRSWAQTLLGRRRLRSLEGKGLFWFDDFVYGKGQFDHLLEIISQLQNASATQPQDTH
jgi:hypothetical protein